MIVKLLALFQKWRGEIFTACRVLDTSSNSDEMLANKNDYRAGLVKGHIMTSALGLNSGQQILELGSRWVCDLEAPSSQASASIMWQLEEELTL
ncbi:unnamed protein product [Prunus brigantina]